ncbi:hypothetical protein RhiirB3_455061 [Rhizophagus irregularis]|nr:hypothetical protein RhiirB3_455061 [Rhizophagus irregularis]
MITEEQEAFYSKSYDLNIPDNFDDSNSNYASTSKTSRKLKVKDCLKYLNP